MGEPLANYRNVKGAIQRITSELGIGARKITVSTVGIVPNIRKLFEDPDLPPVRLAVSLHCATDEERSALLPANDRNGGLDALMMTLRDYLQQTGRRITLEWALIEGQNDTPETARTLGRLIRRFALRRDMIHVNVIPLNPTGGFAGSPSQRSRVNLFCQTLEEEFGVACTPRVRRGIDIDAGCGQLKSKVTREREQKQQQQTEAEAEDSPAAAAAQDSATASASPPALKLTDFLPQTPPSVGVYEEDEADDDEEEQEENHSENGSNQDMSADQVAAAASTVSFELLDAAVDFDEPDAYEDPTFTDAAEKAEAARLIALVKGTTIVLNENSEGKEDRRNESIQQRAETTPPTKKKKRKKPRRTNGASSSSSRVTL